MMSFLGVGSITPLAKVFTFLFVFVVMFGIFEATKLFGEGKAGINALVALFVAILANLSTRLVAVVNYITPWFVLVFILLFFIAMGAKFFGEEKGFGIVKEPVIMWVLIIISGIIVLIGFIKTRPEKVAESVSKAAIIDPVILAVIMVFLIAMFAIIFLAGAGKEKK